MALPLIAVLAVGFSTAATAKKAPDLSERQVEKIVRLSYPYVALYNVNNKFALDESSPMNAGGWNKMAVNTVLADHTLQVIPRPNNDTFYLGAMVDVRREPIILEFPSFESKYVSLMVTAYDHYVNVPMATSMGDFDKPSRILFYSQRTPGYGGDPVRGVDQVMELTGDFVSAILRVMPHSNDPALLERNRAAMREVNLLSLSEFLDEDASEVEFVPWQTPPGVERDLDIRRHETEFPPFGRTDFDIFEENLLEVMQFVLDHTTFDPNDENDQALLAAYKPLGVEPGKVPDPETTVQIDGQRFRKAAQAIAGQTLAQINDPEFSALFSTELFLPKGEMDQELLMMLSIVGPIGLPAHQALYPPITTMGGNPMNAMHDYVIRMDANALPPANAFWSVTLYDTENGFFIPNESKKYSIGENAGMRLDAQGGIEIYVAAKKPNGVPSENWLPLNRGDYGIDLVMRIYAPDLDRYKSWRTPKAERIK
jgi:hypothetical protein